MRPKNSSNSWVNAIKSILLPGMLIIIFMVVTKGKFANINILKTVCVQSVTAVLLTMSIALLMDLGLWNFSLGSMIYCAAILGGNLMQMTDTGLFGLVVFPILVCVALSGGLALLYTKLGRPLMIVSLGCTLIYESFSRVLFSGKGFHLRFSQSILSQAPYCFAFLLIATILFYCIYNLSLFGHNLRAVGASQEISHSNGLDIRRIKIIAILISGLFAGMASTNYLCTQVNVEPVVEFGSISMIFDAMLGTYIAFFLRRYCNYTFGILIGSFTMKVLQAGLISCGMSSTARNIILGFFLLCVLIYSSNQGRYGAYREKRALADEILKQQAQAAKS